MNRNEVRIAELVASRARIIATADQDRVRLQRDLHDGAQQRLVHAVIALKMARDSVAAGSAAAELVEEALTHAERASSELRGIVHQILPRSLVSGGLRTGLESLVADLDLPVDVQVDTPRLSAALETTAYLIAAEAITNAVRHAKARRGQLNVELAGNILVVEIRDDGVGGADPVRGTGLTGLFDRVAAMAGSLDMTSPAGGGTTVRAELPVAPDTVRTSASTGGIRS